jgi:hypothetical protein
MRLLKHATSHQKTRKMEVRYDPEQVSVPCDKGVLTCGAATEEACEDIRQLHDFFLETKNTSTVPIHGLKCFFKNAHIK